MALSFRSSAAARVQVVGRYPSVSLQLCRPFFPRRCHFPSIVAEIGGPNEPPIQPKPISPILDIFRQKEELSYEAKLLEKLKKEDTVAAEKEEAEMWERNTKVFIWSMVLLCSVITFFTSGIDLYEKVGKHIANQMIKQGK